MHHAHVYKGGEEADGLRGRTMWGVLLGLLVLVGFGPPSFPSHGGGKGEGEGVGEGKGWRPLP